MKDRDENMPQYIVSDPDDNYAIVDATDPEDALDEAFIVGGLVAAESDADLTVVPYENWVAHGSLDSQKLP